MQKIRLFKVKKMEYISSLILQKIAETSYFVQFVGVVARL